MTVHVITVLVPCRHFHLHKTLRFRYLVFCVAIVPSVYCSPNYASRYKLHPNFPSLDLLHFILPCTTHSAKFNSCLMPSFGIRSTLKDLLVVLLTHLDRLHAHDGLWDAQKRNQAPLTTSTPSNSYPLLGHSLPFKHLSHNYDLSHVLLVAMRATHSLHVGAFYPIFVCYFVTTLAFHGKVDCMFWYCSIKNIIFSGKGKYKN